MVLPAAAGRRCAGHAENGNGADKENEMLDHNGKLLNIAAKIAGIRKGRAAEAPSHAGGTYDKEYQKPVLKCSICNGEQVAGFKDIRTGKFEEVALIRNGKELDDFKKLYGIDEISKEY